MGALIRIVAYLPGAVAGLIAAGIVLAAGGIEALIPALVAGGLLGGGVTIGWRAWLDRGRE